MAQDIWDSWRCRLPEHGVQLRPHARVLALAAVPVDDDNQLLAYGNLPAQRLRLGARMSLINLELVEKVRTMQRE